MLSFIVFMSAWVGALVKMAQWKRWGWFVFLLLLNYMGMLIYIIAGPTTETDPMSFDYPANGYHWVPMPTPWGDQGGWKK